MATTRQEYGWKQARVRLGSIDSKDVVALVSGNSPTCMDSKIIEKEQT